MASKVSNFSDLIQRVAASCLLHPLAAGRHDSGGNRSGDEDEEYESDDQEDEEEEGSEEEEEKERCRAWEGTKEEVRVERVVEMERLMSEVFDAVSAMKRAYVGLQESHCPWDPEKMRVADVAVVAELRRLGVLRERFRRRMRRGCGGGAFVARRKRVSGGVAVREVVAPYESAVDELKREVKARESEVESLKEKLRNVAVSSLGPSGTNGKKGSAGSNQSRRKLSSSTIQGQACPAPELFEATMRQVKEASKSFTSLLLSLMRSARWDISAAVRSIEAAADTVPATTTTSSSLVIAPHHAKYALESYVSRKLFQGFDHETFYMDGSLSSLLNPDQFRRDCFTQYRDMKAMDPTELLGILPTCHFGKFCSKKYLSIVHSKMEESLFGDSDQRRQVLAGNHPRSQFYGEFLVLAKAVWLLHLLAFSLDPAPSQFEASRGAEFHPQYMESVVRFPGGRVPSGQVVGFPVSPGFKLGNGSVIKARVLLISRT
ncbi:protein GRAVITROPIC IN THE LIGHT 1 [Corylus avellana]|uniref:protein GRAVITROPIC IN THE LIGHT 1 n=1 Tax=Corylus avellana TaxID=13451 RepID=UPI001E1F9B70|nr:protein GRAVITROPIC IN THE LIGHT 1 [Corylus avellana]